MLGIEGKKLLTPEDDFEALKEFNHAYEGTKTAVEDMHLEYQALLQAEGPSEDPWGGGQPSSRTGENPPYGMIGRIEETSASFEARSAPRSYPTPISGHRRRVLENAHVAKQALRAHATTDSGTSRYRRRSRSERRTQLDHPKADISSAFDHPAHRDRPQHAGLAAAHKPPPGKGGGVCRAKTFIVLRRITGTVEPQRGNIPLLCS